MTTEGPTPTPPEVLAKVEEIIVRARSGDTSVLPLLRELMTRHPALWEKYGDLGATVEQSWAALAAGPDLLMRESLLLYANKLRAELTRPSASPVERLLVERAVATWLQLNYFSGIEAADLDQRASPKLLEYRGKRQAQAQRLHEKALAALLVVQKLLPAGREPAPVVTPVASPVAAEADQNQNATPERTRVPARLAVPVEAETELTESVERLRVTC
jgi:hypothetical protein